MSDHSGTSSRGRRMVLPAFVLCFAGACAAAMDAGEVNRQTAHPCNALRASLALDTAKFGVEGELGELVVGAYTVEGVAVGLGFVTLTHLPGVATSADTLEPRYIGEVSLEGLSRFARIDPGHYQIEASAIGFERQTQNLRIISTRTDTVCFTMRSMRLDFGL